MDNNFNAFITSNGENFASFNGTHFSVMAVADNKEALLEKFKLSLKVAFLAKLIIETDRIIKEDGAEVNQRVNTSAKEGKEEVSLAEKNLVAC